MDTAPTVYFIDDSATMREVIKIAFRRENINVIACHDAASAFAQIEQQAPDVVITDVIMPDKDGYEVCQHIKHHPTLSKTPVILMSGVVNKAVADKAFAVKADELIRKPFQPQDLITRVRHLLNPAAAVPVAMPAAAAASSAAALSSIFSQAPAAANLRTRPAMPPVSAPPPAYQQQYAAPAPPPQQYAAAAPAAAPRVIPPMPQRPVPAGATAPASLDLQKMKLELMRLENLVKKLQSELEAEREYTRALEEHVKTLTESER
ncbi:MAG: PleD family two-component system response regulator [Terriglobales bacterium]|jgi:CheY-like chemotaxis protein